MIENHVKYTRSTVAQGILDAWNDYLPRFVKVMPVDYKRALGLMGRMQSRPQEKQQPAVVSDRDVLEWL